MVLNANAIDVKSTFGRRNKRWEHQKISSLFPFAPPTPSTFNSQLIFFSFFWSSPFVDPIFGLLFTLQIVTLFLNFPSIHSFDPIVLVIYSSGSIDFSRFIGYTILGWWLGVEVQDAVFDWLVNLGWLSFWWANEDGIAVFWFWAFRKLPWS